MLSLGLYPKGPYLSLEKEKENFCVVFTYSIKRAREIRYFHVVVGSDGKELYKKNVARMQSCCFANLNLLFLLILIAIAVPIVVLYCCDPKILLPW